LLILCGWSCRKFFGAKGAPPQQQSKLSFSTKADKKEEEVTEDEDVKMESEGDVSAKENSDPQKGEFGDLAWIHGLAKC
jgi:hypothetical protein